MDNIFDPKNSLWLEIVRVVGILINGLILVLSFIALIMRELDIAYFLLIILVIAILHLIQMLSLNLLYNIQQIRINSDKQIIIQEKILDMLNGNESSNEQREGIVNNDHVENIEVDTPIVAESDDLPSSNEIKNSIEAEKDLEAEDEIEKTKEDNIIQSEKENKTFVSPIHGKVFMPDDDQKSSVKIPSGFDSIGEYAFKNNEILEEIYIPLSIKKVLMQAFVDCINLKRVFYEGSKEDWQAIKFSGYNEELMEAEIVFNY
ncbi:leucine-rich repeat protein [Hujiaoplasma nucleasis]|uniref:Leucine-rich repeat protein n=1 Tax=Hujiaoplasma nucleasis TaxID=2725268 RepID=A0A7L6N316_9MOLU|nr:leucine-rich repeat protein [Hujiaoplasma nucleasis]QLY40666.1 leucine-rich repeat protein [Hujiaoplasma nucleasis]